MEEDKAFDPTDVGLLGPQTIVPGPNRLTDLVKQLGFARCGSPGYLEAMERSVLSREASVLSTRMPWQKPWTKVASIRSPSDRFLNHTPPFQNVRGIEGMCFLRGVTPAEP
jgi:hypothetical protein